MGEYTALDVATGVPKKLRERTAPELRRRAREGTAAQKREALAELRRRVGNLRNAVIPAWERALRGPDPSKWELVNV